MAVQMHEGNLPHIYWIDLKGDGVFTECAVVKRDGLGNVYYFPLTALDDIDKRRLGRILTNRNATNFELWDLMSNITLNNGVNALTYFHQLVNVITPGGKIMKPREGVVGAGSGGVIDTRSADARKSMEEAANAAANAAASAAANAAAQAIYAGNRNALQTGQTVTEAAEPTSTKKTTKKKTTKKSTSK